MNACTHPSPYLADTIPLLDSDTVLLRYRCFACNETWTEEVTVGELARGRALAEDRLADDELHARVYEENVRTA